MNGKPLAYVIQGSGPHFCPGGMTDSHSHCSTQLGGLVAFCLVCDAGGNPNPKLYPGHIALTVNQLLFCVSVR